MNRERQLEGKQQGMRAADIRSDPDRYSYANEEYIYTDQDIRQERQTRGLDDRQMSARGSNRNRSTGSSREERSLSGHDDARSSREVRDNEEQNTERRRMFIHAGDGRYYEGEYSQSSGELQGGGLFFAEEWSVTGPYRGKGPKNYRRADEEIRDEACRCLEMDGAVDATDVEVECRDGILTLSGMVSDRQTKRMAERCVESIYGVNDVMNELRIDRRESAPDSEKTHTESPGPNLDRGSGSRKL